MGIVANVIAPIIQLIFYLALIFGIGFWFYKMLKPVTPKIRLFFKYKILKKPLNEGDIEWCMGAIEKGWDEDLIKKFLLLRQKPIHQIEDILYIFNQVQQTMKGGINNNDKRIK